MERDFPREMWRLKEKTWPNFHSVTTRPSKQRGWQLSLTPNVINTYEQYNSVVILRFVVPQTDNEVSL